jgi:CHAD domain-containing protein
MTSDTSTHLEVELKLDAEADFVLPDLSALPGVSSVEDGVLQQLKAVYLDSPDLRLVRSGTTFRRRTGGTDAGWHLKLPPTRTGTGTGRLEVRRAAGRSVQSVPPKLLELVRVQLRGESVAPVARITTHRTVRRLLDARGVVLAEVADDQVTAEAMGEELTTTSWREIEVELVEGDEALLNAAAVLLTAAGARPSDSGSKLRRALAHRLDQLTVSTPANGSPLLKSAGKSKQNKEKNNPRGKAEARARKREPLAGDVALQYLRAHVAALLSQDPLVRLEAEDGVHQMRVATRRLRATLSTFSTLFQPGSVESLREELKWLGGVLGSARDAEVMRARLTKEIAAQPAELVVGPVQRRVDLELNETYRTAREHVLEALDGERYLNLVAALEQFVSAPPFDTPASAEASSQVQALVRKAGRRVRKASAALDATGSRMAVSDREHPLHEVRKAAKRARYAAEAAVPVAGKRAKRMARSMEQIQETLGNHQDAVVAQTWLRDLGMRAFLNGENAFTFGRLHGLIETRAQHDEQMFADTWKATRRVLAAWPG